MHAGEFILARSASRRAFTLIELLVSIGVIALLIGVLIVGVRAATRTAKSAADTQSASSLRLAVEQFRTEFGFVPPLVKDNGPNGTSEPIDSKSRPVVYREAVEEDAEILRNRPAQAADRRYSVYSLAYYLVGALDSASDGVKGAGFRPPAGDGSFKLQERRNIEPLVDLGRSAFKLIGVGDADEGRFELRDKNDVPIRYYRWLAGREEPAGSGSFKVEESADLNVPVIVGDPDANPKLREATFAIVMAGANGLFGDEPADTMRQKLGVGNNVSLPELIKQATADNVVEAGR